MPTIIHSNSELYLAFLLSEILYPVACSFEMLHAHRLFLVQLFQYEINTKEFKDLI